MDYISFQRLAQEQIAKYPVEIHEELDVSKKYKTEEKDILIVVKDQLSYVQSCIESIYRNTQNFKLYVWDNNSKEETAKYLDGLKAIKDNFQLWRSESNEGFILPNNYLAARGVSPYVILLNSDTIVFPGWDQVMIAWLQQKDDSVVGYMGSKLNHEGKGGCVAYGHNADYICGWCMCMPRTICKKYGPFDQENLTFAYGEDSDFCFRVQEDGKSVYSLHIAGLVLHFGNKTSNQLRAEGYDFRESFEANHDYIRSRWARFLGTQQGS